MKSIHDYISKRKFGSLVRYYHSMYTFLKVSTTMMESLANLPNSACKNMSTCKSLIQWFVSFIVFNEFVYFDE